MITNDKIKLYLLDLDGTVYLSDRLIDGVAEKLEEIKKNGKKYCFLTNNSSKSYEEYILKLQKLGISVQDKELFTSTMSAIKFLNKNFAKKTVYCVACDSVKKELKSSGLNLVDGQAEIVLLCYDTTLTYQKIAEACKLIRNGSKFIVTHSDKVCPSLEGGLPDVGSFINLIYTTVGRLPDYDCGKPSAIMGENISEYFNLNPSEIAMVGDRLYTDIAFGNLCGFDTYLVLSGETDIKMLAESQDKPKFVIESLSGLQI